MLISFISFMIDLYNGSYVQAYMYKFFLKKKKKTSQKLLTGFLPNFIEMFLRYRLKKSGLWSDTGACGAI